MSKKAAVKKDGNSNNKRKKGDNKEDNKKTKSQSKNNEIPLKKVRVEEIIIFEPLYGIDEYDDDDDDDDGGGDNNNINDNTLSNTCFSITPPPLIVDYRTLLPITVLPNDWSKFSAANRAAKDLGNNNYNNYNNNNYNNIIIIKSNRFYRSFNGLC